MVLLSELCIVVQFFCELYRFNPSVDCGPFSGYNRPYTVISELVGELPNWLEDALTYLGTPAVFVPVLILMM